MVREWHSPNHFVYSLKTQAVEPAFFTTLYVFLLSGDFKKCQCTGRSHVDNNVIFADFRNRKLVPLAVHQLIYLDILASLDAGHIEVYDCCFKANAGFDFCHI